MKKVLFLLIAIIFAIQGWSQTTLNEGFEGATFPPNDWTIATTSGSGGWQSSTTLAHNGSKSAKSAYNFNSCTWLITPKLSVTSDVTNFAFWIATDDWYGDGDNIEIFVSTTDNQTSSFSTTPLLSLTENNVTESWAQHSVDLSAYIDQDIYVAIRVTDNYSFNTFIDDITGPNLFVPSCPKPTALVASNPTITGANLGWTDATGSLWNIQYMLATSTDWANATTISGVTTNPYTFTSLNSSTTYKARVQRDCTTGQSEWSSPIPFQTECAAITSFPWAEGFEGLSAANTLPNSCWTATSLGTKTGTQNTNYNSYNRNARTGTGAAWFKYDCNDSFKTPSFQFAANTSYDFSFWYVTDGLSGWNTLRAELWDSTTNTLVDTLGSQVNNPANTTYLLYNSSFTVPNENDSYYVSIYCQSTSNLYEPNYLTIDDISVETTPTCPHTYNLTSTLRSSTSVDLNWMQNGNENGWVIAYGDTTAFDPSSIAQPIIISSTDPVPYTVTGLIPNTPYSFAVRHNCDGGSWSNIVYSITPGPAATLPYSHSFENYTENNAWSFINGTQTNQWVIGTTADTLGTTGLYISNDQGVTNAYTGGSSNVSRVYAYRDFEVPVGVGELELSFDWRAQGGSSQTDFLRMYLVPIDANITAGVVPPNGLDASAQIGNYNGGTGVQRLNQSTVWRHKTMRINSLQFPNLAGRTWRLLVHWRNESSTTTGIQPPAAVDNINLSIVACPSPSALVSSNVTATSALLTWNENGSATDWIIEYKPSFSTTWSTYQTTSNPDSITNLIPGTSYNARLRSLCSDTSLYSNSITFQTLCVTQTVPTPVEGFFLATMPPTICWSRMNGILPETGNATLTSTYSGWRWNSNVTPHNAAMQIYGSNKNWLISPSIDLGDGTSPAQIEFDAFYTKYNTINAADTNGTDDRFAVVVSTDDGLTWNAANATIWSNATSATKILNNISNTPTHITLPLFDPETTLPYTGNVKIGFYGESTVSNANNDIHVDNFEVLPYSACQRPTAVVSTATATDAIVHFTENGSATSWQYVYENAATITDPATGTAITTTTNPIELTGLTPQTQYNIWVRSICDDGNSDWSVVGTFVTEALPANLPYTCDFENATENLAWKSLSNGINKWVMGTAAGNGHTTQDSTDTIANYLSNDNGVSYATTYADIYAYSYRDIDFGTDPASYNLSFDWKCEGYQSSTSNHVYAGLKVYLRDTSEAINSSGFPINPNDNLGTFVNSSAWQYARLSINDVSGVKRLIFVYFDGWYGASPAAIDNISLSQTTCLRPVSVIASNLTTTSAEISWVHPGADSYIVSYRTNTTGSTFTDEAVTTSPYTIQGLTLRTQYLVSVRAICGNDTTMYSSNIIFQTPCVDAVVSQYPYIDDFSSGIGCWLSLSSGTAASGFWQSATSGSNPTTTPHSQSNMLYFNNYNNGIANGYLISSEFDIPAATPMAVDFWMVRDGEIGFTTFNEYVEILVNSTQSLTGAISLGLVHRTLRMTPADSIAGWREYLFTIPDSIIGPRYFIIKAQGAGGYNMFVDDFSVISLSCPTPSGVTASNTATTADISWTGTDNAMAWNIEYKAESDTAWTIVPTTTNPSTISGLVAATSYLVRVQTDCGTNGLSNYGSSTFVTCYDEPISTFPYTEGFENGLNCWEQEYVTGTTNWTNILNLYNRPHTGTGFANFHGTSGNKTKLISPIINISSLSQPYLSFWHMDLHGDQNGLKIFYRESVDNAWTELLYFTSITSYQKDSILLPEASSTYQIAFEGYQNYGYGIALDDITVYDNQTAPCIDPTSVLVSNVGTTTADVSWIAGGSETSWKVRLGTTGTPVTVTSPTYHLTGLNTGTTYTVYVRANCGAGSSSWVASAPFTPLLISPTVVTNAATSIAQTTATLNGTVTPGTETITAQGFEWRAVGASTWTTVNATGTTINYNLTSLTANTAYEFKAFATTASGTIYGTTLNLTTLPEGVTPATVVTNAATAIAQTIATLNGTITPGTETITAQGFEWRAVGTSTWTTANATGTTITYNLTSLTANTAYEFKAFATTASGNTYGTTSNFTTLPNVAPTVVTNAATSIAQTIATLNGAVTPGTETITAQGFEWRAVGTSSWTSVNATGATINYNLTGLTANTAYEFKAFATTASGNTYGTTSNFTTLPNVAPTVVTNAATSIAQTIATLNGEVTPGTETITAQGFEWRAVGASTWTSVNATGSTINHNLIGLTANTAYEFKAFATTASGNTYGTTSNFTTLPNVLPSVTTTATTNITKTSATFNGTTAQGTESIQARGFEYKQTSSSSWTGAIDVTASGTTTILANVTGLTANTQYDVRAYAQTQTDNRTYGNVETFRTDSVSGLSDIDANKLSVTMYPNPANNTTKLVVSGVEGETDIIINDVQGKLIYKTTAKAVNGKVEKTIDVNNFAKGVYYVRIQNQTTSRTQKLIVIN